MSKQLISSHVGSNTIPNTPFLTQILRHAQHPRRLAIRDANSSPPLERRYVDLVLDALVLRELLRAKLPTGARESLKRLDSRNGEITDGDTVFIGVLASGGYEYVVAIVAVWMLGACVVPMCRCCFYTWVLRYLLERYP